MRKPLFQPESGILTVQYTPNAYTQLIENPPRFTWMAALQEDDHYVLQFSSSADFAEELTSTIRPISFNLYTPDHALAPGTYYWRYALLEPILETADLFRDSDEHSEWSLVRSFTVPVNLPETPLPGRRERYTNTDQAHPRLWLNWAELEDFRYRVRHNANECGWVEFYEKSVAPWLHRELIPEPAHYPDNKRLAKLWRQMYIDCQESRYAIRHLSVAGIVLEDIVVIEKAKLWLLHVND